MPNEYSKRRTLLAACLANPGKIIETEELRMLFHINRTENPDAKSPLTGTSTSYSTSPQMTSSYHNSLTDPTALDSAKCPPANVGHCKSSRSPDAPEGQQYDDADKSLSVGRNGRVRRALSNLRSEYNSGMSITECATRILEIVRDFGLEPVDPPTPPQPITPDDLGVVCYQVVLPAI